MSVLTRVTALAIGVTLLVEYQCFPDIQVEALPGEHDVGAELRHRRGRGRRVLAQRLGALRPIGVGVADQAQS